MSEGATTPAPAVITNVHSLSESSILTVLITMFFLVLAFFGVAQSRSEQRKRILAQFPRDAMPLNTKTLKKRAYTTIIQEHERERNIRVEPQHELNDGRGALGTSFAENHFRTDIARSFVLIAKEAAHNQPSMSLQRGVHVPDYVRRLQRVFNISPRLTAYYIDIYNEAAFGETCFSQDQFAVFIKRFLALLLHFDDRVSRQYIERCERMVFGDEEMSELDYNEFMDRAKYLNIQRSEDG